ncbi:MAG: DivIVA domain-containing protein [Clostridia bacterium]|nr:DivIVA domain-containing protein [Clostridia bacterium]
MFGRKAKELKEQLDKSGAENEQLRKRVEELEAEVKKLRDQEELVVRAITEANRTANRIEREANDKRDELVAEAEDRVRDAKDKASDIMQKADEDAQNVRREADDYSENVRTDANIYVERTIFASQSEVRKREDVVKEMNEMLRKTTAYLNEQTEAFNAMLKSVIDENEEQSKEICKDVNKCSCSCKDCKNPCENKKDDDGEDEDEDGGEGEETEAEAVSEPEPEPAETPSEDAAAFLDGDEPVDPSKLPEDYKDPAELMKNIYYLQKRDIPNISLFPGVSEKQELSDPVPEGGISFEDQMNKPEKPHEATLEELVAEIIPAS